MGPASVATLRRVDAFAIVGALLVSVIALVFYWTRDWIHFGPSAIPWVVLPLLPHALQGFGTRRVAGRAQTRGPVVSSMVGAIALLLLCMYLYLPYLSGGMVFYLRMSLGMSIPVLGIVAVFFFVLTFALARRSRKLNDAV